MKHILIFCFNFGLSKTYKKQRTAMNKEKSEKNNNTKADKKRANKDHDDFTRGILSLPQLTKKLLIYALDDKMKRFINFDTLRPLSGDLLISSCV